MALPPTVPWGTHIRQTLNLTRVSEYSRSLPDLCCIRRCYLTMVAFLFFMQIGEWLDTHISFLFRGDVAWLGCRLWTRCLTRKSLKAVFFDWASTWSQDSVTFWTSPALDRNYSCRRLGCFGGYVHDGHLVSYLVVGSPGLASSTSSLEGKVKKTRIGGVRGGINNS
jgi:hypothetical protein